MKTKWIQHSCNIKAAQVLQLHTITFIRGCFDALLQHYVLLSRHAHTLRRLRLLSVNLWARDSVEGVLPAILNLLENAVLDLDRGGLMLTTLWIESAVLLG